MSDLKVSIIIPFHNVQDYIETCLRGIVNQTLKDIEIICVDDSSDDASSDIVKRFNDTRIKLINLSERKGQGYARNIGLSEAKGEYIGFVDADDWVNETMFEKLYNRAKEFNSDIAMCKTVLFDEQKQQEVYNGYYQLEKLNNFKDKSFSVFDIKNDILNINVAIWNKIYRREFLGCSKFPEGFIFEDLPFFFETFLKAQNISMVDENLYYYRINRSGSTMDGIGQKVCDRIEMLRSSYNYLKSSYIFSKIESDVLNWLVEDIFHRASLIEPKYFEEYFKKAKEFLREIGFTSTDNMRNKGVIFLDEVLFWLDKTPMEALFFVRTFRTTDKKLDKLYAELSKVYSYSWETANSQLQPVKDDVYKTNLRINDLKADFDYRNSEIENFKNYKNKEMEEFKTSLSDEVWKNINQIRTTSDEWSKYFNGEFSKIYNNFTAQAIQNEENMKMQLSVQKNEICEQQNAEHLNLENRLNRADLMLENKVKDKMEETIQFLNSQFEQEKKKIEEECDKKLNEQRVKYERKLIKIEEDYDNLYRKLEPVIKLLKFFGLNREKGNGK